MRNEQKKTSSLLLVTLIILSLPVVATVDEEGHGDAFAPGVSQARYSPKNVILLIGDGMGFNHVAAASYYRYGKADGFRWQSFSEQLAMSTFAIGGHYEPSLAASNADYVKSDYTDSAAAATALSCGRKTSYGAIGVGSKGRELAHLMERAEEVGKSTGVVTSVQLSHATPAGFTAHNPNRGNYAQIALEMIGSRLEVIMGAGHPFYDNDGRKNKKPITFKYVGGQEAWSELKSGRAGGDADGDGKADKWTFIQKNNQFRRLRRGDTPKRVFGVARVIGTLQQSRSAAPDLDSPAAEERAFQSPRNKNVPTLATMTAGALNVLDNDPDGFVLMVEGGAVDWASHANQTARMVEEMLDFDDSVRVVIDWVESNSSWDETLVIVTADHECGYLLGPCKQPDPAKKVKSNGSEKLPGLSWHSSSHTNSLVPVYAEGAAAAGLRRYVVNTDPIRGAYIDNTHIARYILRLLD